MPLCDILKQYHTNLLKKDFLSSGACNVSSLLWEPSSQLSSLFVSLPSHLSLSNIWLNGNLAKPASGWDFREEFLGYNQWRLCRQCTVSRLQRQEVLLSGEPYCWTGQRGASGSTRNGDTGNSGWNSGFGELWWYSWRQHDCYLNKYSFLYMNVHCFTWKQKSPWK